jgi:hypothetical protein
MRNGVFTVYQGIHLPINTIRDNEQEVFIRFEGMECPFVDFQRSKHEDNVFLKRIKISEINETYEVKTYGIYKGYKFQIFKSNDSDDLFIGISNEEAHHKLKLFGDSDWAYRNVRKTEIDKVWEERLASAFGKSMPKELKEIEEINL